MEKTLSANGGVNPFLIGKNNGVGSPGAGGRGAYGGWSAARLASSPSPVPQAPETPLPMPMDATADAGGHTSLAGYPGDAGSVPTATVAEPFPGGLPGVPMPPSPASRPDWPQAEPAASVVRGMRARTPRIRRPGSDGIGSRSTMSTMYRDSAQARGVVEGPSSKPVTDVDYEFQQPSQPPAPQASAAQPETAPADSPVFDSLDEFVDLRKPSKFKAGRGKKNMLVSRSSTKAAAKPTKSAKPAKSGRPEKTDAGTAYGYDAPTVGAGMATAVRLFYKKYARFAGRASKSEYWWVMLFMSIVSSVLSIVPVVGLPLLLVLMLASLVPGLALVWRRAHDADKPWFPWLYVGSAALSAMLAPFVLVLMLIPGVVDGKLAGCLVLADVVAGLLTLVLSIVLGLLPSKQSGSRFDKK